MDTNRRPLAVDLFAGAGGMSLGIEQAGFDVACAVEYNPIHAATHLFNMPTTAMIVDSVVDLDSDRIRQHLSDRRLDLLTGGPPCQGFSTIGRKSLDDDRNRLVVEFVRLVGELRPRYFVMENVKGLTLGRNKLFLDEVIAALGAKGYAVLPWRVLNAGDYGVPQNRERLILIGHSLDERRPEYPKVQGRLVSCRDALADLPDVDHFAELLSSDSIDWEQPIATSAYAEEMACRRGGWWFGPRRPLRGRLTSSMRTIHSETSRSRFANAPIGRLEEVTRFFKIDPDQRCNTLRAGTDASRGSFTSPRPIHYRDARCVTVREMARLHGIPDWFRLHVTKAHGARQVGNSVPPPLARSVGGAIMTALGYEPQEREDVAPLGDEKLLSMTMQQACRHFGVEDPIGFRDVS